jgi:hypothetical protein
MIGKRVGSRLQAVVNMAGDKVSAKDCARVEQYDGIDSAAKGDHQARIAGKAGKRLNQRRGERIARPVFSSGQFP